MIDPDNDVSHEPASMAVVRNHTMVGHSTTNGIAFNLSKKQSTDQETEDELKERQTAMDERVKNFIEGEIGINDKVNKLMEHRSVADGKTNRYIDNQIAMDEKRNLEAQTASEKHANKLKEGRTAMYEIGKKSLEGQSAMDIKNSNLFDNQLSKDDETSNWLGGQSFTNIKTKNLAENETHVCMDSEQTSFGAKIEKSNYLCGVCSHSFNTICLLHEHMITIHWLCGSYSYHYEVHTAFPKCESICQFTQTEEIGFIREGVYETENLDDVCDANMDVECSVADTSGSAEGKDLMDKEETDGYQSDKTDVYFEQREPNLDSIDEVKSSSVEINQSGKSRKSVRKGCINKSSGTKKSQERKANTCRKSRRKPAVVCRKMGVKDSLVKNRNVPYDIRDNKASKADNSAELRPDVGELTVVKEEMNESENMESYNESKCYICGVTFSVKQALLRHEQQKHLDEMKYQCDVCDKKFMRTFNLQKHVTRVHGKSNKAKAIQNDLNTCSQSDAKSDGTLELELSLIMDKDETGDSSSKKICRRRRTNAEVEIMKTPHTCEICGHTMPKYKMDVHRRLHTGERPFVCSICGKGLISQNKLSRHMMIHTEKKKHTCDVCGVGFHMKYKLRMHMHIHTGNKPYLCSICGAEFNHSANLATHTRCVHLQVKPYECNICGGKYSKRSQLDDHVFSHSAERKFTCRYCGKTFKYYKGMRRHEKSHTEEESYTCDDCGLKFARKENLDRHKVTHGSSEFQCKVCKKVLKDGRALQEHEFTHLVAKGCKCSSCGEMFYSSNKFFNHLFAVHNIAKQEAQLMIIDEQLKQNSKQCVTELEKQPTSDNGMAQNVPKAASIFEIVEDDSKDTMSLLTRVATENLRLHSQDVCAAEKVNIITPPINPMILYDKNGVTSLDHVTTNRHYVLGPKDVGNAQMNVAGFPNHGYGQHLKQSNEPGNPGNNCRVLALQSGDNNVAHGLNETVLGFVTSNTLTSISNLTSYIGQRSNSLTPLSNLNVGLHQDEHGAIESLRRLQDNPALPVTVGSNSDGLIDNSAPHNVLLPTTVTNIDTSQADYRIQNLF